MAIQAYTLKRADRCAGGKERAEVGETVYRLQSYDYGLANDDTHFTGIPHVSVTRDPNGAGYYFTVPTEDLEEIDKSEHPATQLVHWPSGAVPCCDRHAENLKRLGRVMGLHVASTALTEPTDCTNCVNREIGQ